MKARRGKEHSRRVECDWFTYYFYLHFSCSITQLSYLNTCPALSWSYITLIWHLRMLRLNCAQLSSLNKYQEAFSQQPALYQRFWRLFFLRSQPRFHRVTTYCYAMPSGILLDKHVSRLRPHIAWGTDRHSETLRTTISALHLSELKHFTAVPKDTCQLFHNCSPSTYLSDLFIPFKLLESEQSVVLRILLRSARCALWLNLNTVQICLNLNSSEL